MRLIKKLFSVIFTFGFWRGLASLRGHLTRFAVFFFGLTYKFDCCGFAVVLKKKSKKNNLLIISSDLAAGQAVQGLK